jgi:hypothetical protein
LKALPVPGGNFTGLQPRAENQKVSGRRLLEEAVPKLARVAVLYDPATPGSTREVKEDLPVAARARPGGNITGCR